MRGFPGVFLSDMAFLDEASAGLYTVYMCFNNRNSAGRRQKTKQEGFMEKVFTHFDQNGNAVMVDVSGKQVT